MEPETRAWVVTRLVAFVLLVVALVLNAGTSELNQGLTKGLIKGFHLELYFKVLFLTFQ